MLRGDKKLIGEPVGEYKLQIPLTEEEVSQRESQFFANHRHINAHQRKLDDAKQEFKDHTAQQITENKRLMAELDAGYIEKEVRAVEYPNFEEGVFEYYGEADSNLIVTKPMTAKEKRQFRLMYNNQE